MSETKTRDEERREPLLGGQQHNSNIEVKKKKKKKKEEKKKESKPCFSPRGKRTYVTLLMEIVRASLTN
jgi:hypothetical protein